MRIITWNCNMAFRKKADFILTYNPDILIVPECENPDKLLFSINTPKPTDVLWFGKIITKDLQYFLIVIFVLHFLKITTMIYK